jgi:uncharacterized protein (TIGR03435 family)
MDSPAEKYFLLVEEGLFRNGSMEQGPLSNAPPYFIVRPTHYATARSYGWTDGVWLIGRNEGLKNLISSAYGVSQDYRLVFPDYLPDVHYDFLVYAPKGGDKRFQEEIRKRFGYTARREMRNEDVWVMKVKNTNAPWLTPSRGPLALPGLDHGRATTNPASEQNLMMNFQSYPLSSLLFVTEQWLGKPVIDQTGLSGNYDVKLAWHGGKEELREGILEQWGLELSASNLPIEKLIVEKTGK